MNPVFSNLKAQGAMPSSRAPSYSLLSMAALWKHQDPKPQCAHHHLPEQALLLLPRLLPHVACCCTGSLQLLRAQTCTFAMECQWLI